MNNKSFNIPNNNKFETQIEDCLTFYKIMNYPIPKNYQYFLYNKKNNSDSGNISNTIECKNGFSWETKNSLMDEYIEYINRFGWLYRSLPFVKEIYLCNSITFNALKETSDINLFIVTKKDNIWLARFFSVLLFTILGLKRSIKNKNKKFCLSFYITQDHKNLYSISLPNVDIYLAYWLAHLVPLYFEDKINTGIITDNKRFHSLLPNFPNQFIINIGNKLFHGKTQLKKILEFIFGGLIGFIVGLTIKNIRLPIVISKTKQLKEQGWGIIINNNMLKFHLDTRKKIHLLFKINNNNK